MNTTSGDMLRAGVSSLWIGLGGLALWCGLICLIMGGTGMGDDSSSILECGGGCVMFSVLLIGSGVAWYRWVRPSAEAPR